MTGATTGGRTAPDTTDARATEAWLADQEFDAALDAADVARLAAIAESPTRRAGLFAAITLLGRSSAELMAHGGDNPREAAEEFIELLGTIERRVEQHRRELSLMETAAMRLHVVNAKRYAQLFGAPDEGARAADGAVRDGAPAGGPGDDQARAAREVARALLEILDAAVDALAEAEGDADETLPPGIDSGPERRALLAAVARLEEARHRVRADGGTGEEGDGAGVLPERLLVHGVPAYADVPADLVGACLARALAPLELLARAGTGGFGHEVVVAALASARSWVEVARQALGRVGGAGSS